ncbi:MAG TPA: YHYH protein [Opitutaceae bacterium]|nr:YHYH protein [Opitutaceae bacterium]
MRILPRFLTVLAAAALAVVPLAAHPDYNATHRTEVDVIPATESAPGPNKVSITIEGEKRVIVSNGLPDHTTGRFPNADNPNRITAQSYRFTIPAKPVAETRATPLRMQPFGIAVNGVLFDPGTAEYWQNDRGSGWHYDAKGDAFSLGLDANNAHVQPNGAYHYHGIPTALLARLSKGKPAMALLGWAADGFPIYGVWGHRSGPDAASELVVLRTSYRLKKGNRPTANGQPGGAYDGSFVEDFEYAAGSGDLDECSGRFGVTPEFPEGTYYYVLTADYPFVPRFFRGVPDKSFDRREPPPGGPGGRRGPPPPL